MKLAIFDAHRFEKPFFERANADFGHELTFFETSFNAQTAPLAEGFPAICCFVNDRLDEAALQELARQGVRFIALRSAGFNHVDLEAAARLGIRVARVPAYSPHAVAEHAVCLILALNRKIHRAYQRVREHNFSLDGLVGFDLQGKTVGVLGTGRIGATFARIMRGFGCAVLAYDLYPDPELARDPEISYLPLAEVLQRADIVSLHVPLTPETRHLIDGAALASLKRGAMLINTGRGALIDTPALIEALKSGQLGAAGLDVYEEEEKLFFRDLSEEILPDDCLARLLTFPNVLITAHQAFLTREALDQIARTTLQNAQDFEMRRQLVNEVRAASHVSRG